MSEFTHAWADLLDRYIKGSIAPQELEELNRQMATSALKQQQFKEYTDADLRMQLAVGRQALTRAGWKKLVDTYSLLRSPWYKKTVYIRSLAAAAVVVIVVAAWLLLPAHGEQPNYPYLLLANGNRINLNNTANGIIDDLYVKIEKKDSLLFVKQKPAAGSGAAVSYITLFNPGGGNYGIELSDGTLIKLNAATWLKFPDQFTGNNRQVEASGQAYFNVSDHNKMAFTVLTAADTKIEVTGTEFDLAAYKEEDLVQITLVKGSVRVNKGTETFSLHAGQQYIGRKGLPVSILDSVNIKRITAWTENKFDFEGATIEQIAYELGRWYNLQVELNGALPRETYSGWFKRSDNREDLIKSLEDSYQVIIQTTGNKLTVSARR